MLSWTFKPILALALTASLAEAYRVPSIGVVPPAAQEKSQPAALARTGIKDVQQALDLEPGALTVFFGYDEIGRGKVVALDPRKQLALPVTTYSSHDQTSEFSFMRHTPVSLLAFPVRPGSEGSPAYCVLVKYSLDYSGPTITSRKTYVESFVLRDQKVSGQGPREQIAEEDYVFMKSDQTNGQWRYVDAKALDAGELKPGRRVETRLLVRDANGDGYTDLVVWKRESVARWNPEGDAEEKWKKERDTLSVALFDPKTGTLAKLVEDPKLPEPPEELWREAP